MKLKANDTLLISSVGPENIPPGAEFEVSDDIGRQLIERGLATASKGGSQAKAEATDDQKASVSVKAPASKRSAPAPARKAAKRKAK